MKRENTTAASGCALGCYTLMVPVVALSIMTIIGALLRGYGSVYKPGSVAFFEQQIAFVRGNLDEISAEIKRVPTEANAGERIATVMATLEQRDAGLLDNDSVIMYDAIVREVEKIVPEKSARELGASVFEPDSNRMAVRMMVARYYANAIPMDFADAVIGFDVLTWHMYGRDMSPSEAHQWLQRVVYEKNKYDAHVHSVKGLHDTIIFVLSVFVAVGILIIIVSLRAALRALRAGAAIEGGQR